MITQDWSPLGWTGWIFLQSKGLLQHHSSKASVLWHSAFFTVQLSHPYMTTGKTIAFQLNRLIIIKKILKTEITKIRNIPIFVFYENKASVDTLKILILTCVDKLHICRMNFCENFFYFFYFINSDFCCKWCVHNWERFRSGDGFLNHGLRESK